MALPDETFVEDARKEIAAALTESNQCSGTEIGRALNRILAVHASIVLASLELQRESNERQHVAAAEINILSKVVPKMLAPDAPGDPHDLLRADLSPTNAFTTCPNCRNSYAAEGFDVCPHCYCTAATREKTK